MSIYENKAFLVYCIVLAFIFGTCMGSFLNCAAWRIVRGESFVKGHSRCPACGHELGLRDLIPVISWMSTKGRCRYCGDKVSIRYPVTEIVFGFVSVACLLEFDLTVLCLRNYIFLAILFLLTLTDIDDMTIPDGCHIAAVITWIAAEPFIFKGWSHVISHVAAGMVFGFGLLAVSLVLDRVMGRDTLGGGDIKLIAVTGLYLGFIGNLFTLMIACFAGLLFNIVTKRTGEDGTFPFGPWIAGAAAVMLLYGEPLINWYQNLLF